MSAEASLILCGCSATDTYTHMDRVTVGCVMYGLRVNISGYYWNEEPVLSQCSQQLGLVTGLLSMRTMDLVNLLLLFKH